VADSWVFRPICLQLFPGDGAAKFPPGKSAQDHDHGLRENGVFLVNLPNSRCHHFNFSVWLRIRGRLQGVGRSAAARD
jgi:hypothetical protein